MHSHDCTAPLGMVCVSGGATVSGNLLPQIFWWSETIGKLVRRTNRYGRFQRLLHVMLSIACPGGWFESACEHHQLRAGLSDLLS